MNSLKDFIKSIELEFDPKPRNFKIFPVIDTILGQSILAKNAHGLEINTEIDNTQLSINTSYKLMYNCLQIIIDNAVDAIKSKNTEENFKPYIKVNTQIHNDQLCVSITDNGISPPPNIVKKMFDLTTTTKKESGGYGLWRAKSIALSLSGNLNFKFSGNSKTFELCLPTDKEISISRTVNSLVVEDDEGWNDMLSRWLGSVGHDVDTASSEKDAKYLLKADRNKYSYIFLDVSLKFEFSSNVDGLNLIESAKKYHPDSKIILVTANAKIIKSYGDVVDNIILKNNNGETLKKLIFLKKLGLNDGDY